ncbi:50S ribosomal protein L25/general stress protein Ctc [uncultured Amnibacterium sp.]|uniref:50S ribosomal protein L25/general stress protein Ctc n=1 Tax=uncultured Amnibacterium sp. TaxID=1631851 RepID=UPI0035C9BBF0
MAEKIAAEARTTFGKGAARKLRASGRIPAVVYGHGTDPVHISLPAHETGLIIRRANSVLDLDLAGGALMALVKDVQRDPVRQIIEHLDLIIVRTGEQVEVDVPILLEGESAPGTVATLDTQTLLLKVLATAIPQHVIVSVQGLEDGAHITAADVELPEGAELAADPELLIIGVQLEAAEESLENEAAASETVSSAS